MSDIEKRQGMQGWWKGLDTGHQVVVVAGALSGICAIVAAIILGIFGLIDSDEPTSQTPTAGVVSGEPGIPGDEDQSGIQPPEEDAVTAEEPRSETSDKLQPEPEPELTSGNGNSRAKATRLFAGVPMDKAVDNGADIDWYVYRAPKEEEVELSLSMDEPEEEDGSQYVSILKGNDTIKDDSITTSEPFEYAETLAGGEEIYVRIQDDCGSGCGVASYRLTLNTGPPG
jgi:hypothetical protein